MLHNVDSYDNGEHGWTSSRHSVTCCCRGLSIHKSLQLPRDSFSEIGLDNPAAIKETITNQP